MRYQLFDCKKLIGYSFLLIFGSFFLTASPAFASLVFGPTGEFSNGITTLSGQVTVDFIDTATGVDIKIDTNDLLASAGEKIVGLYLNFDQSFGGTLVASEFSSSDTPTASFAVNNNRATAATNPFKADGDGFFNIVISWASNAALLADKMFTISVTDALIDAADFLNQVSVNGPVGKNGFEGALRVISIPNGAGSGFFAPIPEATAFAVWLGLTGVVCASRRFR